MTLRINWFPDPNITGTVKPSTGNGVNIDYQLVDGRHWIRATSTATGDNYVDYILSDSQLPPAGSYHIHARACAQRNTAYFMVYSHANGKYSTTLSVPVGDGQTVVVDRTITIPAGCDDIRVRIWIDSQTVGAIGMMSDILIERADTYATAVGGGLPGFFTGDTMPRA